METQRLAVAQLQFRLFGAFEARLNGNLIDGLHKRKCEQLLAYLILAGPRWVEKEEVARAFWDGDIIDDPEANLRQSLTYLRGLLGEAATCIESRVGGIRLVINEWQADTREFEAACLRGDARSLELARSLYEEALLSGWNEGWIGTYREKLERRLRCAEERLQQVEIFKQPAARQRSTPPSPISSGSTGGALHLDSERYVVREADAALIAALQSKDSIVLLKGARQTGKTSMLARGLHHAREQNYSVFHIDCSQFSEDDLSTRDGLYINLLGQIADQGEIDFSMETDWKPHLGANGNVERFVRRRLLDGTRKPILLALDGVDRLFRTTFYNDFFALLRGFHSRRATEPGVGWSQLTVLIAAATEAHLYISDLNQSPFNVGTRIPLGDFTLAQATELCERHGFDTWNGPDRQVLTDLMGGHPYLLSRALVEIQARSATPQEFASIASAPDGPFHDHLHCILKHILADDGLRIDLLATLSGQPCSEHGFFRLRSAGVISGDSPNEPRMRCGLYSAYFSRNLI